MGQDILMTGRAGPPVMHRKHAKKMKCDACAKHVKSGSFDDATAKRINHVQEAHARKKFKI